MWYFSYVLQANFRLVRENSLVGFEVLTAVSMKMAVFWVVALCRLVGVYQRFRGPCCLHHQGYRPDNVGKLLSDYMAQQPRRQPSGFVMFAS
jgi:hypothetical protein